MSKIFLVIYLEAGKCW